MKCSIQDCTLAYYSKDFCKKHYDKNRRRGDPLFERQTFKGKPCTFKDCSKPITYSKLCSTHAMQKNRASNPTLKAAEVERTKRWKANNLEKHRAHLSARGRRTRQATPKWINMEEIYSIYLKRDPTTHDVDHILPLTHDDVCGLHVPWNLEIVARGPNESKKNKFDYTYDNLTHRPWAKKPA